MIGKEIRTDISTNPLFNEDGTYKGVLAIVTDVTKKVKLQQQLLYEQNKQRGIYGAYCFCNKTYKRYFQE
jgi:hypothetical protein